MTFEELDKNKIRFLYSVRKDNGKTNFFGDEYCYGVECEDCIFDGENCLIDHNIVKAKEELQKWVDEHPLVTNRDKAREVFGIELNGSVCNEVMYLHEM